jgi:hypothetical protein
MPFGRKPMGGGRFYDFDKVYRVIIRRAVQQAGLEPARADEQTGSHVIHTDMFKSLRDHAVVLADLSLHNPNVFYELGIRHVMSPRGTVLMCQSGADLPFDVKLSRVIFYDYDGEHLDWEEAERTVQSLQFALQEARSGKPDSPVHALLENVLPTQHKLARQGLPGRPGRRDALDQYQKLLASQWKQQGLSLVDLQRDHGVSTFGARALGYYCLDTQAAAEEARKVANNLYDLEQYDLANKIFARLDEAGLLVLRGLLRYASSVSEEDQSPRGAERGLEIVNRAFSVIARKLQDPDPDPETIKDAARCYQASAGLQVWKWQQSERDNDLDEAIALLQKALEYGERAKAMDRGWRVARLAENHLRLVLLLRLREGNPDRADMERHREAILGLEPGEPVDAADASYLRWYKAIALADAGDEEGARRLTLAAFAEDARVMNQPGCWDVGRWEYMHLRRLLEQFSHALRNLSLVGHVSQVLQVGHES